MIDLSSSSLGWIEFGDTRMPFCDRIRKPYRAIGIMLSPENRELVFKLSPIKEVGILATRHIPVYKGRMVSGMFKADIQGGQGKLRSMSEGFAIGREDLENPMLAYYEIGQPSEDSAKERLGIPVKVVPTIVGTGQITIVPKIRTVLASPDLNGKTISIRCEFPLPEPGPGISDDCLTPTILSGDRITRYLRPKLMPWDKTRKTTFIFKDWVKEDTESLRG